MAKYKIEKGIPIQDKDADKFPWATMKPGDSFLMKDRKLARGVYTSFSQFQNIHGEQLDLKVVKRKVVNGYRVWLVRDE